MRTVFNRHRIWKNFSAYNINWFRQIKYLSLKSKEEMGDFIHIRFWDNQVVKIPRED
jgi:hypothetical protein